MGICIFNKSLNWFFKKIKNDNIIEHLPCARHSSEHVRGALTQSSQQPCEVWLFLICIFEAQMLRITCDLSTGAFDLEPGWRAIDMKSLRTAAPPAGRSGPPSWLAVKGSVAAPPVAMRTDALSQLSRSRSESGCHVVTEAVVCWAPQCTSACLSLRCQRGDPLGNIICGAPPVCQA